jgi:uncharacterized membrane protein YphA (DoxX/SURF4 family)
MTNLKIDRAWRSLRITYGLVAFLAGLDKFFHILTNWDNYLSPTVVSLSPVSGATLMHAVGVIEMAVGLLILTQWTRIGAYVASAWLICIALNLLLVGSYFDVAVRDLALSVGAWTLAQLSEVREPASNRVAPAAAVNPLHI